MKNQNRNALLLLDNTGVHNLSDSLIIEKITNVKLHYLLPYTNSVLQPCDADLSD